MNKQFPPKGDPGRSLPDHSALIPYVARRIVPGAEQRRLGDQLMKFAHNDAKVMVVDGYAGTGKTTMIAAFVRYLQAREQPVVLLASTGRAAKILSQKARFPAETLHRHIYILEIQEVDHIRKTKRLVFKIRANFTPEDTVYVVDESSMIADHPSKGQFLNYGSGRLLADFLTFAGKRKVVFVGDSCQLPPVNVAYPPVFEADYFNRKFEIDPMRFRLTEQMRFSMESGIFKLSDEWRRAIDAGRTLSLNINTAQFGDVHTVIDAGNMARELARRIKTYGIDQCVGICFTNKAAFNHSQAVRTELFRNAGTINPGEILIVVQNNYLHNITNGEHIVIEKLGSATRRAGLTFRVFTARMNDFQGERAIQGLLIEDLLYSPVPGLSNEQETELMVDFMIRMKNKGVKENTEEFFRQQITDHYLNALRVKFGYVITCHKAQGGEWDEVFVDVENSLLNNPSDFYLRWAYTAVTRSAKTVYMLKKSFIR